MMTRDEAQKIRGSFYGDHLAPLESKPETESSGAPPCDEQEAWVVAIKEAQQRRREAVRDQQEG